MRGCGFRLFRVEDSGFRTEGVGRGSGVEGLGFMTNSYQLPRLQA